MTTLKGGVLVIVDGQDAVGPVAVRVSRMPVAKAGIQAFKMQDP